ncbi:MAG: histidine kinase N-terminal 7TM domain-containing protein [Haloarculaceae archaeon]
MSLLLLSVLSTAALSGYAWRNRTEYGATAFFGLLVTFTVYSGAHLIGVLTTDPGWRLFWESVQWVGTATIPVFWLLFAISYTGHEEFLDRRRLLAVSVVPALTIILTWTNPLHGLMWTDNTLLVVDGLAIFQQVFGPWFWVNTVFTYSLVAIGAVLLLRLVWRSDHLYADQAILLVVGVAVPILASGLSVLPTGVVNSQQLDLTPYSFVVSGFAFGYALFHQRLFDLLPATRQLGRSAVINHLEDGIVIVDTSQSVLYLNPTARTLFDCSPAEALGASVRSLVGESTIGFETEDALAELEINGDVYEVRTSPINDRYNSLTGHTLVFQDITARKQRESRLATQREELERVATLNTAIRGVHRALVTATNRTEIREAVCGRLIESGLYRSAHAADVATIHGDADNWTVVGAECETPSPGSELLDTLQLQSSRKPTPVLVDSDPQSGPRVAVPVVYGPTVYGVLVLFPSGVDDADHRSITDREREVLAELGELIGHANNALEMRNLVSAESIVELSFESRDKDGTLLGVASRADCRLELRGLIRRGADNTLVYLSATDATADEVSSAFAALEPTHSRIVRENGDDVLIELTLPDDTLLGTLVSEGAHVRSVTTDSQHTSAIVEVPSDADVRTLSETVGSAFPATTLTSKQSHTRPVTGSERLLPGAMTELTDRQREVIETAYQAGYFDWPRGSTAEEIAETLGITAPTLHAHLRKAEARLLADLFDDETPKQNE